MGADPDSNHRAQQRVGSVLRGKYHLDRVLGIGGMAAVYAATHRNQKQLAIKMLHSQWSIQGEIRQRFLREGYAANSVKHPGVVAVLDDDVAEDGAAFLVMELLEGTSVEEVWEKRGRKLPVEAALAMGHQLLDVLAAAHAKGIIHRDIKPANLFLTLEHQVKVLDFGIARVRDVVATGAERTGTGVLLGTPAFMAPEQALARSSEIGEKTDIWAVGATLFALLGGQCVHEGENAAQMLVKAATTPARSLATVNRDIPSVVVDVVDRALAFRASERWQNSVQMRDAVARAHQAITGRAVSRESLTALGAPIPPFAPIPAQPAHRVWPGITTSRAVSAPPESQAYSGVPKGRATLLALTTIAGLGLTAGGIVAIRFHAQPAGRPAATSDTSPGPAQATTIGEVAPPAPPQQPQVVVPAAAATSGGATRGRSWTEHDSGGRKEPVPPLAATPAASASSETGARSLGLSETNPFR